MKQALKNKLVALLFVAAVLTPLLVQASHAFDKHEHIVCTAKDVKHFHADELDCLLCCTLVEFNSFIAFDAIEIDAPYEYSSDIINHTLFSPTRVNKSKSSRAPPLLLA